MKRLKVLILLAGLAVLFVPAIGYAQKAVPNDPSRIAAAKDLMIAMGSHNQFNTAIDTMTQGMSAIVKRQQPGKDKDIDEVFGLLRDKFHARSGEILDMVAPLWAEKFTVDEMKQIGAFFKTPIGAKMLAAQPEIIQKSMQLGMTWGANIGKEVEAEAKAELKKRGIDL